MGALHITTDWVVGVIRVGSADTFRGPVPNTKYDFVVSIIREGDSAFLYGAAGEFNRAMYKKIVEALRAQGIYKVRWERLNTDRPRAIEVDLNV